MKRQIPALLVFVLATAAAAPAPIELGTYRLAPSSCGVRDTLWIEHYATRLYLPGDDPAALTEPQAPKALHVLILNPWFMPAEIPRRWRKALEPVLEPQDMARLREAYRALKPEDLILASYLPDEGLVLSINGEEIAAAKGHAAIDALLDAWAREKSAEAKLRRAIANNPC